MRQQNQVLHVIFSNFLNTDVQGPWAMEPEVGRETFLMSTGDSRRENQTFPMFTPSGFLRTVVRNPHLRFRRPYAGA